MSNPLKICLNIYAPGITRKKSEYFLQGATQIIDMRKFAF